MTINKELIVPIILGIIIIFLMVFMGGILIRHALGLCSCNQPKVETNASSFVERIETDRPNFLPLTDTEIQRVEAEKEKIKIKAEAEKKRKAIREKRKEIEKKRHDHKRKYGTLDCEVCCSDHMECKHCNAKMTLTAQQKRELDNRERAYKERDRRRGRRR